MEVNLRIFFTSTVTPFQLIANLPYNEAMKPSFQTKRIL